MSTSPLSPKLMKGAIVAVSSSVIASSVIVFQYNPETLSRTIKPRWLEDASKSEVSRLSGAPEEEIKVEIELDATDGLETGDPIATAMGVYPRLSALELLVYPSTLDVIANTGLLAAGTIEIIPAAGPFTVFVYGPSRVLPVKITELSVTEELHDPMLNPIRAKVQLGMKVLSYNDLSSTHPGYGMFLAHQVIKEAMALVAKVGSVADVLSGGAVSF